MNKDCIFNNFCNENCAFHDGCDDKNKDDKKEKCISYILCEQAKISHCEAQLFCEVTERLTCEVQRARNLIELQKVINMINDFLTASAAKEKSIAEIIEAGQVRII